MYKNIDLDLGQISTIFFDVDGIFTDGSLYFMDNGSSMTKFNVYDGMGCNLLKEAGLELLILTARHSDAVVKRFKELGITKIFTKVLKKRDFIKDYCSRQFLIYLKFKNKCLNIVGQKLLRLNQLFWLMLYSK